MRNLVFSGLYYGKHITIKQISKTTAKKLFCAGEKIYITSSNMHPFGIWQQCYDICLDDDQFKNDIDYYNYCKENNFTPLPIEPTKEYQFTNRINNFSFYNCDNERGKYITFYQQIKF
jgi:hypothetical protein